MAAKPVQKKSYKDPLEFMREKHIQYRETAKAEGIWYNFQVCPACGHEDFQCGLLDARTAGGGVAVKCWHEGDNPWGQQNIRYSDLLRHCGYDIPVVLTVHSNSEAPAKGVNPEYLKRCISQLHASPEALAWVAKRGFNAKTIKHFSLGLKSVATDQSGVKKGNFLCAPLIDSDGNLVKKYCYYNIPGLSVNPTSEKGWSPGQARASFSGSVRGKDMLIVVEGFKDLWSVHQLLEGTSLAKTVAVVTSSNGRAIPAEWKSQAFWAPWKTVYLAQDNDATGQAIVENVLGFMGREARRLLIPADIGKDANDLLRHGATPADFQALMGAAKTAAPKLIPVGSTAALPPGRYTVADKPTDINGAWVNGHLYYPLSTIVIEVLVDPESGARVQKEAYEKCVVRSDRTMHKMVKNQVPDGFNRKDALTRLTDGLLIEKEPDVSQYHNWDFAAAKAYLEEKTVTPPLAELYDKLVGHFKGTTWLPYDEDYTVLALVALLSYVQPIFAAVPYLCLNGPMGSGKSQLGSALCAVSYNGINAGQSSHAAMGRILNEARGLLYLDDLEQIGERSERTGQIRVNPRYAELVQALKQSYTKETAARTLVNKDTNRPERLNLYGIKVVSNTGGSETILGSRMIFITTQYVPNELRAREREREPLTPSGCRALVNHLHCWAFENAGRVDQLYQSRGRSFDRESQIFLPLRIMGELVGRGDINDILDSVQRRQSARRADQFSPVEMLREALNGLIRQGYKSKIALTHLVLEIKRISEHGLGKSYEGQIPQHVQPLWIAKRLREELAAVVVDDLDRRVKKAGKGHRAFQVADEYVSKERLTVGPDKSGGEFCTTECAKCPYYAYDCPISAELMLKKKT